MRLLFSEVKSDYSHYLFPYAVWALPEKNESPGLMFQRGFLPSSRQLDRFYLCRHVRVNLKSFSPSSENRRILRKGEAIEVRLLPRQDFDFSPAWQDFCLRYAEAKFGAAVMSRERLLQLFSSPIVSHLLLYRDRDRDLDVGLATLYCEAPAMAFYYYAFYDLDYFRRNLGMVMMTRAVSRMQQHGLEYIYLGSCYSRNALYKTQFSGAEFFNGFCWSGDLRQLKALIERDQGPVTCHLLENGEFMDDFYPGGVSQLGELTQFR